MDHPKSIEDPASSSLEGSGSSKVIAGLADLDADTLQRRWRAITGRQAPLGLPRHVLLRMLAYRIQIDTRGGLDPATEKFLERLGRTISARAADGRDGPRGAPGRTNQSAFTNGCAGQGASKNIAIPGSASITPGTILAREHDGVVHWVMATGDGFAWNGSTYPSLSKVAYAITGVSWSGPRFFGLLGKRHQPPTSKDGDPPKAPPKSLKRKLQPAARSV